MANFVDSVATNPESRDHRSVLELKPITITVRDSLKISGLEIVAQAVELRPPEYISFGCYQMDDNGLALLVTKGKGDEKTIETIPVSGPFEILGRVRDPKGEGWARLLRWTDEDTHGHNRRSR